MRLFVAVDVEPHVLERVEHICAAQRALAPDARWVRPEQLHLTLEFLGEVAEERLPELRERLDAVAARQREFSVAVRSAGGFPRAARPRVLWLGVDGETAALEALQAAVHAALSPFIAERDDREYRAHLTLARAVDRRGDVALGRCAAALQAADCGTSQIREVVLYQSRLSPRGATYVAQHRARLGSAQQ